MKYKRVDCRWYQYGVFANFSNMFSHTLRANLFDSTMTPYGLRWFIGHGVWDEV